MSQQEFRGRKSFGHFECPNSVSGDLTRVPAHAQRNFKQGCKRCENFSHARFLWQNEEEEERRDRNETRTGPPHDA